MIELKSKILNNTFIVHYAEDSQGNRYYIKQVETGIIYEEAVDVLPCRYRYVVTDKPIEILPDAFNST
jgi:hypothetical protein